MQNGGTFWLIFRRSPPWIPCPLHCPPHETKKPIDADASHSVDARHHERFPEDARRHSKRACKPPRRGGLERNGTHSNMHHSHRITESHTLTLVHSVTHYHPHTLNHTHYDSHTITDTPTLPHSLTHAHGHSHIVTCTLTHYSRPQNSQIH